MNSVLKFSPLKVHEVPLAGRNLIEASAGTGKTFNITGLYARLILGASIAPDAPSYDAQRGLLPESILVVTFTKAATAELKDRIRLRLAQLTQTFIDQSPVLINGEAEPFCAEVLGRVVAENLDPAPLLAQLRLALATLDQAAISTIHSFCQRLLSEQAFEAGYDFDRTLLEDETDLLAEISNDFWRSELYGAAPEWVLFLQQQGINNAGLRELARRVKSLNPDSILPLPAPMSDEALAAQQARNAQLWEQCRNSWDAVAIRNLLLQGIAAKQFDGRKVQERWLDGWIAPVDAALKNTAPCLDLPEQWERLTSGFIQSVLKADFPALSSQPFFALAENYRLSAATLKTDLELKFKYWLLSFGAYVRRELHRRKAASGQMSFDDSLTTLAAALQNPTRAQHLAAKVSQRYKAALVDEFQDTDPTQFTIINQLFGQTLIDAETGTPHKPPFFMVGDPKQAIYAFRGADVYAYLNAREQADEKYSIDTNFRSDAAIVAFVNALFREQNAFVEDKIQHPEIHAKHSGASKLQCSDGKGAIHAWVFDGANSEAAEKALINAVGDEIAALLNAAGRGEARLGERALSPKDIAVLVPSHRQAEQVRKALAKRGVAAVMQTRESVFASSEAAGLYEMLAAIEEPAHSGLLRKALVSSVMGMSVADLMVLQQDDEAWQQQIEHLQSWRDEWRKNGFMPLFRRWLVEANVTQNLLNQGDGERRLTNLLHVAELIQQESRSRPSPAVLLAWLARQISEPGQSGEQQQMRLESDADRVRLVTIHASKGLEYPVVFCPFSWKGKKDLVRDSDIVHFHDASDGEQLKIDIGTSEQESHLQRAQFEAYAEQVRLLYVAVTRAKHRLYLVYPAFEALHSSSVSGLKNAPLSQVLRDESGQPLRNNLKDLSQARIKTAFERLMTADPGALTISDLPERQRLQAASVAAPSLSVATLNRKYLAAPWRLVSFTSLTRAHGSADTLAEVGADHDLASPVVASVNAEAAPDEIRFAFTRGSKAGTALHAILEHADFARDDVASLGALVESQLLRAGLLTETDQTSPDQFNPERPSELPTQVAHWLLDVLAAPITLAQGTFSLKQLSKSQRLNEWPFLLGCQSFDLPAFCRVLAQPEFNVDARFIAAAQRLKPEKIAAYLNGVVDLVFEWQGQYFIADYKSNHLGDALVDYGRESLIEVMADAHYYFQYLLYTCAWHRFMQLRRGGQYDYERDFGGVVYLFIRGMSSQAMNNGVYMDKPQVGLIEALNKALGLGAGQ
ncbi:exodeoxyribonuclease V subunit beta [Chitinibacter sp. GC72]|uniref:exodeoxyribonuclease V subunit beta n=1 Tax=Chitinibacter sp. GC72 TaxID=1526917 RepID=UPI0012FBECFD|nr:exodeoxyribonuclease V subunit beta [Chitinibacter sp. GC72]